MTTTWIDFAALKKHVSFQPILLAYGFKVPRREQGSIKIVCPWHDDQKPSLSVCLTPGDGKYQCFGCGEHGNVLDFVARMDGVPLRDAAQKVAALCNTQLPQETAARRPKSRATRAKGSSQHNNHPGRHAAVLDDPGASQEVSTPDVPINPPLSWAPLKSLDPQHPYLEERLRGLHLGAHSLPTAELALAFRLGVGTKGMMKNRLAIAIHNERNEIVAYAGRWALGDDTIPVGEDRYKLPPNFRKSRVLFNLNRVRSAGNAHAPLNHVVVVEGYFATMRLFALGLPVVGLMGRSISEEQVALLREAAPARITVLLDGDTEGRSAAAERVLPALARFFYVRNATARLVDGEQPDEASDSRLLALCAVT